MNTETKNTSNQLSLFVVSCHVDKELTEEIIPSKYEIPIQAGAALTDKRITELNDHDGFDESISNRNHRYSEVSAIYYIWKNIKTPYIGISHYRRRFFLTDELLEKYMEEGVDIIIPEPISLPCSNKEKYIEAHYGYDWTLTLQLIKELSPAYYDTALKFSESNSFSPCCMGIYKREVFDHCCSFLFTILERFYQLREEKKDIYQRRDVGFIAERLFSIYFIYHKNDLNIIESQLLQLTSKSDPEEEVDVTNDEIVKQNAFHLLENRQISRCARLLSYKLADDFSLYLLQSAVYIYTIEKRTHPQTLFEYLEDSCNPEHLIAVFQKLHTLLNDLNVEYSLENQKKFLDFISETRFTYTVIIETLKITTFLSETLINKIAMLFFHAGKKTYVLPLLEFALSVCPNSSMTYLNIAYFLADIKEWELALKYLDYIKEADTEEVAGLRNYLLTNIRR